jgi:hypothetical protein
MLPVCSLDLLEWKSEIFIENQFVNRKLEKRGVVRATSACVGLWIFPDSVVVSFSYYYYNPEINIELTEVSQL